MEDTDYVEFGNGCECLLVVNPICVSFGDEARFEPINASIWLMLDSGDPLTSYWCERFLSSTQYASGRIIKWQSVQKHEYQFTRTCEFRIQDFAKFFYSRIFKL